MPEVIMTVTCTGCRSKCSLKLYRNYWPRYVTQGEAIKAKMEQFKACPHMPVDTRLTNLTKRAPEKQKRYRDIPNTL